MVGHLLPRPHPGEGGGGRRGEGEGGETGVTCTEFVCKCLCGNSHAGAALQGQLRRDG